MSPRWRHLRRMHRRGLIHGNDAKRLQTLGALQHFTQNSSTFVSRLVTVAAQAGHVKKYVRHPVVGNDKSEALRDIEPFNDAAQFDEGRRFVDEFSDCPLPE